MPTRTKVASAKKYFTLQQANSMLPLVRVIIRDIVELARALQDRKERIDRLDPDPNHSDLREEYREEIRQMREQMIRDRHQLVDYKRELLALGVELKDPLTGLVDFPSLVEGREVCLCWMQGETAVQHWHERAAGFAGRKRLRASTRD